MSQNVTPASRILLRTVVGLVATAAGLFVLLFVVATYHVATTAPAPVDVVTSQPAAPAAPTAAPPAAPAVTIPAAPRIPAVPVPVAPVATCWTEDTGELIGGDVALMPSGSTIVPCPVASVDFTDTASVVGARWRHVPRAPGTHAPHAPHAAHNPRAPYSSRTAPA